MKKIITCIVLGVCLFFNTISAFSEETNGEVSEIRNLVTLSSSYEEVYVGEKVEITAAVSNADAGQSVRGVWKVNGTVIPDNNTPDNIVLEEGTQFSCQFTVPADPEASDVTVSFELIDSSGQILSFADKTMALNREIPVTIVSTTQTDKTYYDQKVTASVQVTNQTGRELDLKAHWELNGKKVAGFSSEHFIVGETASSKYTLIPSQYAGQTIKLAFVLDNGLATSSLAIPIKVQNYPVDVSYQRKVAEMRQKIKTIEVECSLVKGTNVYKEYSLKTKTGYKAKGTQGIYVDYSKKKAAKIRFKDGTSGWVPYQNVYISRKNYTDYSGCSEELKEIFVKENGYKSDTKYLIWISLKFQQVNVFTGQKGKWDLARSATCATGKNTTPTIAGVFKYFSFEKRWNFGKYYVAPVMRFNGGHALHSRTYKPDGKLLDPTLGRPASAGCVRMKQEDINWLAANIPLKTTVVVY